MSNDSRVEKALGVIGLDLPPRPQDAIVANKGVGFRFGCLKRLKNGSCHPGGDWHFFLCFFFQTDFVQWEKVVR